MTPSTSPRFSATAIKLAFADGVYVFSPEKVPTHNAGCLMEGLLELGIPVHTNAERVTSREASMPLKGYDLGKLRAPMYQGQSAYVIDISHANHYAPISGLKNARTAYLTTADTSLFCKVPDDVLLFSTHELASARMSGRRVPIGFGLSRSTIADTASPPPFQLRRRRALRNFRATFNQSVRAMLDLTYVPALNERLPVDHTDYAGGGYLAALQDSQVCLAYGGDFFAPPQTNTHLAKSRPEMVADYMFTHLSAPAVLMRWDSWRFWESLVAGCLTVHLDFAKYGFLLPVLPEPWVHYVPLDLSDLKGSIAQMLDREKEWPEIAARGRAWAIEHYAPLPTAVHMLSEILASHA